MPVEKFRSTAEARKALWSESGGDENLRRFASVLELWNRLRPLRFPQGVRKYRSIVEANREMELWRGRSDD